MRYLKNVGKADLCLSVDDIELLEQLRAFLTPFKVFILLVSECSEFVNECSQFILKAFHELNTFNEDLFKYVFHLTTSQKVQEIELSCHSQSQS